MICLPNPKSSSPESLVRLVVVHPTHFLNIITPGYIGGAVYTHLSKYTDFPEYEVTALVRSAEKAKLLESLGINAVIGAHDDETLMESLAAETDIVIATVSRTSDCISQAGLWIYFVFRQMQTVSQLQGPH